MVGSPLGWFLIIIDRSIHTKNYALIYINKKGNRKKDFDFSLF